MRMSLGLVAAVAIAAGLSSGAHSQDVVPGGWSGEIRYQPIVGSAQSYGYGSSFGPYGWNGGVYNSGVVTGTYPARPNYTAWPQTANQLGFLGETVRRTTRIKRSR